MTIEEFNSMRFSAGMKAIYDGEKYNIISCNFPEALFGLIREFDDPNDLECWGWVRCENIILVEGI